mmetsp:Transcript_4839/g.8393  ORF Transcript_4839/g.8393 Transcript_4839/m.8393 type:complete len:202 (+) Transcript_4839:822-1427(+)
MAAFLSRLAARPYKTKPIVQIWTRITKDHKMHTVAENSSPLSSRKSTSRCKPMRIGYGMAKPFWYATAVAAKRAYCCWSLAKKTLAPSQPMHSQSCGRAAASTSTGQSSESASTSMPLVKAAMLKQGMSNSVFNRPISRHVLPPPALMRCLAMRKPSKQITNGRPTDITAFQDADATSDILNSVTSSCDLGFGAHGQTWHF